MQTFLLKLIIAVLSVSCLHAQTLEFNFVESSAGDVVIDTTYDQYGNPEITSYVLKEMNCELSDTNNVASIRIKLGSEQDGSDILNQSFDFNGQVLSPTLSMERLGIICHFTLGQLETRDFTFLKLEALSSSGTILGFYNGLLN